MNNIHAPQSVCFSRDDFGDELEQKLIDYIITLTTAGHQCRIYRLSGEEDLCIAVESDYYDDELNRVSLQWLDDEEYDIIYSHRQQ